MNEGVKVGYAPLSGTVKLTEITREAGTEVMGYDKFDDEEYSGVLNGTNNKGVSKADITATIKGITGGIANYNNITDKAVADKVLAALKKMEGN